MAWRDVLQVVEPRKNGKDRKDSSSAGGNISHISDISGIGREAGVPDRKAAMDAVSRGWLMRLTDREPLEVYFSPAATHAEALAAYPGACAAEPIPERGGL